MWNNWIIFACYAYCNSLYLVLIRYIVLYVGSHTGGVCVVHVLLMYHLQVTHSDVHIMQSRYDDDDVG